VESTIFFNGNDSIIPNYIGLKQGCLLAPYFFLLMGKMFNIMIKQVAKMVRLGVFFYLVGKGIIL
jgi:hypothetical protein